MILNQTLPCPNCGSEILYNVPGLISGASFECANCTSAIKISASSIGQVKEVYEKLTELKTKIFQQ